MAGARVVHAGEGAQEGHALTTDLQALFKCFYKPAHRLRLGELPCLGLSISPNGFFKPLLPGSKWPFRFLNRRAASEVKRPLRNRFRSETAIDLQRMHLTPIPQRTQVAVWV